MNEVWAHIKTFLLNKGLDIAGAAVVLIVGLWAIKLLTRLVSKSKGFRKADPGAAGFLLSFATVALKLVLFLTVISMLGIPVVNFVTILATAGAAVGLAMQGSLSNLVGGVMLLFFKPFKVGDYIKADGQEGTVKAVTVFYTFLTTPDNKVVTLPNGSLTGTAGLFRFWVFPDCTFLDIFRLLSFTTPVGIGGCFSLSADLSFLVFSS